MIAFLRGTLVEAGKDRVFVETKGIGFEVMVPATVLAALPPLGEEVFLHTHLVVREDAWQIYGFFNPQDRDIFSLLLGIAGVGPKLACALLSALPGPHLVSAVLRGDVAALARSPGVGRKVAQRIILDAGDRLQRLSGQMAVGDGSEDAFGDAAAALLELGYRSDEFYPWIEEARQNIRGDATGQQVLRYVLQKMVKRHG
ncbi:MAG: Holliday junction branch migration protein RuvA [Clostridia bacterium]|nr:MAG: Holliday junction branch migration protein RuvA [Clostridia bacterium]